MTSRGRTYVRWTPFLACVIFDVMSIKVENIQHKHVRQMPYVTFGVISFKVEYIQHKLQSRVKKPWQSIFPPRLSTSDPAAKTLTHLHATKFPHAKLQCKMPKIIQQNRKENISDPAAKTLTHLPATKFSHAKPYFKTAKIHTI